MTYKALDEPPKNNIVDESNQLKSNWGAWFGDVHYNLGIKSFQAITEAQPVRVNARYASLKTVGASYAITLEAPTVPQVDLMLEMVLRTGAFDVTMALTNVVNTTGGTTTCTWNSAGDTLLLRSTSNKWLAVAQYGVSIS